MIRRYILSTVCSSFCSRIIPKQRLSSSRPYICSSQHVHCILFVPWHNTQSSLLLVLSSQRRRRSKQQQQQNVCTGDYHAPVFHITTASSTTICRRRTILLKEEVYIYVYICTQYGLSSAAAEKASLAWKHTIWPPQRFLEVPRPPRIIILATSIVQYGSPPQLLTIQRIHQKPKNRGPRRTFEAPFYILHIFYFSILVVCTAAATAGLLGVFVVGNLASTAAASASDLIISFLQPQH